jgi:hypothetical protein
MEKLLRRVRLLILTEDNAESRKKAELSKLPAVMVRSSSVREPCFELIRTK